MIHKRPFVDEDYYEVACKHPRQWEHTNHLASVDIVSSNHPHQKHQNSDGEGGDSVGKCQDEGRLVSASVTEVPNGTNKDLETGTSGCISHLLWVNGGAIAASAESETAVHLSLFPEYFAPGHQLRALFQPDKICSPLLDYPPQKQVSVGPEHQADIPEWGLQVLKSFSKQLDRSDSQVVFAQSLDSDLMANDDVGEKLMGTCVLSMPDSEASVNYCSEGWGTGNDCKCLDQGSVGCIRQHVMEAREKLRDNLGQEIFEELGFCDMGEGVAKKWTEEEEQAFHEVVLSNPASLGKNFWDHLFAVFPSRPKKDLVSYYFNVFMLRKRAEQTRFDPLNIDSDDDEWQKTEHVMGEEDEDSVVESPTDQGSLAYYLEDNGEDCHEDTEEEDEIDACEDFVNVVCGDATDEEDEGDVDEISAAHPGHFIGDCGRNTNFQLLGKIQNKNGDDIDNQDDSCTSFDYQPDKVDCCGPPDMGTDARQSSEE